MISGLYLRIVAIFAIAIALGALFWKGVKVGEGRVHAEWAIERAERTAAALAAEQAARTKEQELQTAANKQRSVSNAKIKSLDFALAESNQRLRNRPERPSGDLPTPAGTGPDAPSCTGALLFRGDALFLSGLAADADRLRIALAACQAAYEGARAVK